MVVMLEPVVLSYLHEATEMEEGKAVMAAYPVCGLSVSVFPT